VISGAAEREKGARPLRADAERNRDRILDAAAQLFAERGLSVPLEDIARSAGVGVATLYRRFPTRTDLAAATFERNISSYTEAVDKALANPRPWEGFRALVFDVCELQARDAGLRDLVTTAFPASSEIERRVRETVEKVKVLIARAQDDGALRRDVVVADLVMMTVANAGILAATSHNAPDAWRRFAALTVEAFRARRDSRPLPPPPDEQQLRRSVALLTGSA
jgi:AcrR family transcriptional regulator